MRHLTLRLASSVKVAQFRAKGDDFVMGSSNASSFFGDKPNRPHHHQQQPNNRYLSSQSNFYSSTHVHDSMDRWIQDFVVPHKICPYAKGSSYAIHVWTLEEMEKGDESILDFCQQHLPLTPPTWVNRPNIFFCFPNVPEFQEFLSFFGFYQALMHVLPHAVGDEAACSRSHDDRTNLVWQSFAFHPRYVDMATDEPNLRFRAPFPSLHCILLSDLEQQRKKPGRSKAINQRNDITLEKPDVKALLRQIHLDTR